MQQVTLPTGEKVAALGLGTWQMAEDRKKRTGEIATIRLALDLGMTLLDTAEMYGEGRAEELIAEALPGRRDQAFIVSKVYPQNATRKGAIEACERSLKRLKTDRIDLYLLHWRGNAPLAETLEAFTALQNAGKIRHHGVSNLDRADMQELWGLPGGKACATDQVMYNLARRGIEWNLLPWCRERKMPVMAYCPIERADLQKDRKLGEFAKQQGMTWAQVALAWLLSKPDVIVIPKTSHPERLRENHAALEFKLDAAQLAELDRLFPPPKGPQPLDMT
jgi:diketogulonate reductase-like aldo/keto reductase